jgi:hypothetical protein
VSFVSKQADAEKMADVARGQLPPDVVEEEGRTSEPVVLGIEVPESEIKPFATALRLLVGAVLFGGGALLWLALGLPGRRSGGLLTSMLFGALLAVGCVVAFAVALLDVARRQRRDKGHPLS